jgi:hypothetical protein
LRSAVAVVLKPQLALSSVATTVNVIAGAEDIVTNTPTAHTDLDASAIAQIPYQNTNAAVSSLLTLATPGIAQDSDGIIHAQGEHQDVQFSVDGQPITDQQSRQFSNQIRSCMGISTTAMARSAPDRVAAVWASAHRAMDPSPASMS